jgi:hypothetical protein
VADADAPPSARVRAATALMDRAGLTPAYAVEVRHSADHAQEQAAQPQLENAERMVLGSVILARGVLRPYPPADAEPDQSCLD